MRCGSYSKDMTSGTRGTVFSVMNLTSLHFTVMVVLMYAAGKGRDWYMRPSNPWIVIMAPQSWCMVPITRVREWTGGAKWNPHPHMLHWASPRKYASLDDERFWTTLCVCPQQCQATDSMWYGNFSGTTGCGDHGLPSSESKHEPNWAYLKPNGGSGSETWMTPFSLHHKCGDLCSKCGLQFAQEEWAPGGKHATSCVCSSCHQRRSHKVLMVWWHGCKIGSHAIWYSIMTPV